MSDSLECGARKRTQLGWEAFCSEPAGHAGDVHQSADFAWQDDSEQAWLKCGERMLLEVCYEPRSHQDDHQSYGLIWNSLPFAVGPNPFEQAAAPVGGTG